VSLSAKILGSVVGEWIENISLVLNEKQILILKVHNKSVHIRLQFAPNESTVSVVSPKGRHKRFIPHLPLATPEADPEKIIKKGKSSQ